MKYILLLVSIIVVISCRKAVVVNQEDITARPQIMCAPPLTDAEWYKMKTKAPLWAGMDILNYPITTKKPEAQKYFNQGLLLAYAFNHAEAGRSFFESTRIDSTCAMCYWGYAYVLGPNYNAGMEADNYIRAYNAIQKAIKLSGNTTTKEKALIKAMAERYIENPVRYRRPLDSAYMLAMKVVHKQYPGDVDIAAMYAESLMDLHPWDLYDHAGNPMPWTPEIVSAIESAIKINPKHPGGHHFYIHAMEASNTPEKALVSCKLFDDGLVPNAGHLAHMPSHIYIHTGDYHQGTLDNIKAVELDSNYVTQCHAQGAYPVTYYPHNYHFLAGCATLGGESEWAIKSAFKLAEQTNTKAMYDHNMVGLQHMNSIPYFIRVKFGKWQDILHEGPPDPSLTYPTGIYHYARGMAYVGIDDLENAKIELSALKKIAAIDSFKQIKIWGFNTMFQILDIAQKTLEGNLLAKQGKYDESIRLLRAAVTGEDHLLYQEPPDWYFSIRHYLGAVLLDAKKPEEAIAVYLEDLKHYPRNGWALNGLRLAYEASNQMDKAKVTEEKFKEAWKYADVQLKGSVVK
jgi:tetratricopeptide (TPR) repeat protein